MTRVEVMADFIDLAKENPEVADELLREIDPIHWIPWARIKNEKLQNLEFVHHLPLMDVLRDWHPYQVAEKGSQIGMTTLQIIKLLFWADNNNITSIYTMPTATDVFEFSQARFATIINSSDYLTSRIKGINNAKLKRMGGSTLYFRGAHKDSQAISVPADLVINDEYDFSDQNVLDTYEKRVGASDLKWFWRFSTPTLPDFGIDSLFKQTDQRHWLVYCDACGKYQKIIFPRNLLRRSGISYFGCYKCQKKLKRRKGQWVAKYPSRAVDEIRDEEGNVLEEATGMRGYKINPLTFTFKSAMDIDKSFKKAQRENKARVWKNFYNFELGEPYVSGETLITRELILKFADNEIENDGYNVIGVDQGDVLHWVIHRIFRNQRHCVRWFGVTNSFAEIARLMVQHNVRSGIIDALPNKHNARDLVQAHRRILYMAYYKEQREESKYVAENKKKDKDRERIRTENETGTLHLDRTETLDTSALRWVSGETFLYHDNVAGISDEEENFIRQMCNMKRDIEEDAQGNDKAVWKKVGDDHFRHADNYAHAASTLYGRGDITQLHVGGSMDEVISGTSMTTLESLLPSDMGAIDFLPTLH